MQGKSAKTPVLQAAGMRGHLEKPSSTGGGSLAGRSHHIQGFAAELRHSRAFFGRPAAARGLGSCFGEGTCLPPCTLGSPRSLSVMHGLQITPLTLLFLLFFSSGRGTPYPKTFMRSWVAAQCAPSATSSAPCG